MTEKSSMMIEKARNSGATFMILYERMVMIASPEIEVENELVKVRQNLAAQIKNNFTEDDPLAKLIEVNANEELLVVALVRNNASFSGRREGPVSE